MAQRKNKKVIVFNWKMNPQSLKEAKSLISTLNTKYLIPNTEFVICPPFVYLNNLKTEKLKNLKFGAQNVFWANPPTGGAYTGEISAKMLKNLGVEYVIIGHSERRGYLGETDDVINIKVLTALKAGLKVILCVGEDLSTRKKGKKFIESFIKNQLQKDLFNISMSHVANPMSLIIAYEPLWAISANKNSHQATPQDAVEISKFIKKFIHVSCRLPHAPVFYGGSVNSEDIKSFIVQSEIDGVLVGSASTDKKELKKIILNFKS